MGRVLHQVRRNKVGAGSRGTDRKKANTELSQGRYTLLGGGPVQWTKVRAGFPEGMTSKFRPKSEKDPAGADRKPWGRNREVCSMP